TPPSDDEIHSNSHASRPSPNGVSARNLQPLALESFATDFSPGAISTARFGAMGCYCCSVALLLQGFSSSGASMILIHRQPAPRNVRRYCLGVMRRCSRK